jgi:hypothetical protein
MPKGAVLQNSVWRQARFTRQWPKHEFQSGQGRAVSTIRLAAGAAPIFLVRRGHRSVALIKKSRVIFGNQMKTQAG